MAEETENENNDDLDLDEDDDGEAGKKGGKGKLIGIIVVALLVVLGGGGGGAFYLGYLDSLLGIEHPDEHAEGDSIDPDADPLDLGVPVYYDIPEFVADLKTGECRSPFLKLALTIQIDQTDQAILVERQPKIIDRILRHLREQERQTLVGKDGADDLREGIFLIINETIKPTKAHNVLFRSMILQ